MMREKGVYEMREKSHPHDIYPARLPNFSFDKCAMKLCTEISLKVLEINQLTGWWTAAVSQPGSSLI